LTAERFVANPFGEGRLYRTGDLGRWNGAGAIEFGGRIDDQVKVRGFRIEPGEIEAVLREHESVVESAVAVFDEELAAYVVLDPSARASFSDLLAFLRGKLPEYMVPGSVTPLEELPLLPSGKLDRAALPVPEKQRATEEFVAAQTEGEQAIAAMWGDLLGVERVGRKDNFFALGGHSLLAARMIGRVAKELGVELPLCSFLQEPTVAALALEIQSR
jgi:acyl carrier protein